MLLKIGKICDLSDICEMVAKSVKMHKILRKFGKIPLILHISSAIAKCIAIRSIMYLHVLPYNWWPYHMDSYPSHPLQNSSIQTTWQEVSQTSLKTRTASQTLTPPFHWPFQLCIPLHFSNVEDVGTISKDNKLLWNKW